MKGSTAIVFVFILSVLLLLARGVEPRGDPGGNWETVMKRQVPREVSEVLPQANFDMKLQGVDTDFDVKSTALIYAAAAPTPV